MAELSVREFANKIIEESGLELSTEAKASIREAENIDDAQRLAVLWNVDTEVVREAATDAGYEFTAGDVSIIRNVREGEDFSDPRADPADGPTNVAAPAAETVDPDAREGRYTVGIRGDEVATPNTGLTPAEQEAMLALTGGDEELAAILAAAEAGEDIEPPGDILPDIPGVSRAMIEAKVATPGYQFYYGDPAEGAYGNAIANPVIYTDGKELEKWAGYSPETRARYTKAMVDAGMIDEEQVGGYERKLTPQEKRLNWEREQKGLDPIDYGFEGTAGGIDPSGVSEIQVEGFKRALGGAGYLGTNPMSAIYVMGQNEDFIKKATRGGGGGGGGRAPFVVPASLRTIPDYPTLQQNVTDMMRQVMGRKPEDWEVTMLADEMQGHYKDKNTASIDAARAAWERGNRGVGEEIEVPDPGQRTQKYLEETWGDEIERIKDIGERSNTNNLLMQSLTQGSRMVGT